MKWARHPRTKFLLAFVGIVAVVVSLVVRLSKVTPARRNTPVVPRQAPANPAAELPIQPSPSPSASMQPSPPPSPVATTQPIISPTPVSTELIIPVAGVRPEQLQDTFTEARSEGRVHDAIDILAPHNTPVLAATDGTIVKLFQSDRGGTTIYELGTNQKYFYYYAHLDHYADGVTEGKVVKQGEVIGYVGDTGNAGPGNYHLHFSISIVTDPKKWWEGTNINPYPLLKKSDSR
jgi:murein DD-endopeptidase MepM/ murein hydrolase activator NlpD